MGDSREGRARVRVAINFRWLLHSCLGSEGTMRRRDGANRTPLITLSQSLDTAVLREASCCFLHTHLRKNKFLPPEKRIAMLFLSI